MNIHLGRSTQVPYMVSLSSTVGWTYLSMFGDRDIEIEVGETLGILHVNRAA